MSGNLQAVLLKVPDNLPFDAVLHSVLQLHKLDTPEWGLPRVGPCLLRAAVDRILQALQIVRILFINFRGQPYLAPTVQNPKLQDYSDYVVWRGSTCF